MQILGDCWLAADEQGLQVDKDVLVGTAVDSGCDWLDRGSSVADERDSELETSPENLLTRSESKSSSLLMTFGSRKV